MLRALPATMRRGAALLQVAALVAIVRASAWLMLQGAVPAADATGLAEANALCVVIMDPLAAQLSCPCVKGYAQRDYTALAEHLEQALGRPVRLGFGSSLAAGLNAAGCKRADLVIGKDSVVRADGVAACMPLEPLCALTDTTGGCAMRGVFVVPADDVAESLEDVFDYVFLLGRPEHAEKHARALDALRAVGIPEPSTVREMDSCSDAAAEILEPEAPAQAVAVISSYAAPLLEGCGTVPKGALRVIGETSPVPFVTAFVPRDTAPPDRDAMAHALLDVASSAALCRRLESSRGFVRLTEQAFGEWPGWRGPRRDGHAASLPPRLPTEPIVVWNRPLSRSGLGGIAASHCHVVFGDRDDADVQDVFRCLDAITGEPLWECAYDAPGSLDYGNSPRATPLLENGRAHLLGAFGDLHCVDLQSGEILWKRHLVRDFAVPKPALSAWGYCASPLLADGRLIVAPGAPEAAVVALDPATGAELWRSPGLPSGYGSFVAAYPGGRGQVIGFDAATLGGWDIVTGKRLWTLKPDVGGGFNVPTPVVLPGHPLRLLVSTETDGTRIYALGDDGQIAPAATMESTELASEMATPVVVGDRVFCVQDRLMDLDINAGLRSTPHEGGRFLDTYAAAVASRDSLLVIGNNCHLLLFDIGADGCRLVSSLAALEQSATAPAFPVYAHPALVGTRLFMRGCNEIACLELAAVDADISISVPRRDDTDE